MSTKISPKTSPKSDVDSTNSLTCLLSIAMCYGVPPGHHINCFLGEFWGSYLGLIAPLYTKRITVVGEKEI